MALSSKQQRFVEEYLRDLNATAAATRAGYSSKTAEQQGSRLLRNVQVAQAIAAAKSKRSERVRVDADEILLELRRIALVDVGEAFTENGYLKPMSEIPADVRRAIAAVDVIQLPGDTGAELRKVKFVGKEKALELLMKHLGMLQDKVTHEVGPSWAELVAASMKPKGGQP